MKKLAYCGFDCSGCAVYIATETADMELRQRLAEQYSTEKRKLTADDILCHGCSEDMPTRHSFCSGCVFRTCARSKSITSCGECKQYPCAEIEKVFPLGGKSRAVLDEINRGTSKL